MKQMQDDDARMQGCTPQMYQIKIQGRLEQSWSAWFNGTRITCEGDVTTMTGVVPDQAALRGLLDRIWNLNLVLISVVRVVENSPGTK
jgi:hypothetical protein